MSLCVCVCVREREREERAHDDNPRAERNMAAERTWPWAACFHMHVRLLVGFYSSHETGINQACADVPPPDTSCSHAASLKTQTQVVVLSPTTEPSDDAINSPERERENENLGGKKKRKISQK